MPYNALFLHFQKIVQYAVFLIVLPVRLFIQTVDEAIIYIIGLKLPHLPVNLVFDRFQFGSPAVFAGLIIGAEMHLIEHFSAHRR